ncbi:MULTISPECIES: copper homeostasis membrane protein CopD [Pantoea]|jgi:putative copper resistance protein D|uniref:Copper resistance protein D n=1 Tax=Pantoea brenneri TaxID=472694 RepID=A0A7Y6TUG3_9GAMM|nr:MULTISPECIES: copper homeostasis membrane protein CopD [Pantoea]MBZ6397989.1 copper homeostasis membrane protein CopD [Pantoea sp.]MBZ6440981.1 copper homeostasis membrane protein CopD [Pantoea sp.]MDU7866052.1 copper homeostasis membrane protein CopD [Pantoea sp.]NUY44396.1 copper homeostasis membrane protein CopD [Pantoea brenneri]NUY51877.1 copper homeostasis membrane protein CopD [Pantoea brenneri]
MNDQTFIVIRFLLYLDLMVLFGLPLFELYALKGVLKKPVSLFSVWSFFFTLISAGIVLSLANMLLVAQSMSGVSDPGELTLHIIEMVVGETAVGMSWVVRLVALAIAFIGLGLRLRNAVLSRYVLMLAGGTALATLAWGGHAAMNDGVSYYVHLLSDIVHLSAAGAWVGALTAFTVLLSIKKASKAAYALQLSGALTGFARAGTVIVISIVITAVVNFVLITEKPLSTLPGSIYGLLLVIKTALFFLMLLLAAANRFRLAPKLENALLQGHYKAGIALMRKSIITEFTVAVLILAIVAWLGTLSPGTGME